MNKKYKAIMISGAVVAVLLIIAAVWLGLQNQSMAAYSAKLAEADQMLEAKDYTNAILKYQEAIDDKPKEEEGYLRLAVAYEFTGHNDYAIQTLETALAMLPGNDRITEKYNQLVGVGKATGSGEVDTALLSALAAKSFYDYGNSVDKVSPLKDGAVKVRVKGINADLIYRNTNDQPEAVSGNKPTANSVPVEVCFDNIMAVLGGGSRATSNDLKALGVSDLKVVNHQDYGTAVTFVYDTFAFTVQSDSDGTITSESENIVTIPSPSVRVGGEIDVKGTVINAVNGQGVQDATLTFRKGGNGEPFQVQADSEGHFIIKLASGEYSVECKAEGFIEETKSVSVPSSSSEWECELIMSPDVSSGEARLVLTWGSSPYDLDSHLIGNGIHVWYDNKNAGSADLDLDDTNGYGPETTTIHDLKGQYTFVVHNFSGDGRLADSGAEVTVYLPGREPVTISIGGNGDASTWVVCKLNNGELEIVNEITEYDF